MKVIIAGGRSMTGPGHKAALWKAIQESGWLEQITEVVSGGAAGIDTLGEAFAKAFELDLHRMPARWNTGGHGKSEGYIRNERMARYADALIAVWDGSSPGTKSMIALAEQYGLKVHVHLYQG